MATAIRTSGTLDAREAPGPGRSVAYLSDGTCVFAFLDVNESDIATDGGDNTGIAKLYVYSAPATTGNRVWTLKNTVTIGLAASNTRADNWSIAVDAANNLHFAWIRSHSDYSVQYIKFTYSAGSWTPAAAVAAMAAPTAGQIRGAIDIDVIGTGDNPIIVTSRWIPTTQGFVLDMAIKNNSAAWVTSAAVTTATGYGSTYVPTLANASVAASTEAAPDGTGFAYAMTTFGWATTTFYGAITARVHQINLTTGAINATIQVAQFSQSNAIQARAFYDSAVSNNKRWVVGLWGSGATYSGGGAFWCNFTAYSVNASMVNTTNSGSATFWSRNVTYDDNTGGYCSAAFSFNKTDRRISVTFVTGNYIMTHTAGMNASGVLVGTSGYTLENDGVPLTGSAGNLGVNWGNAQSRNTDSNCCDKFVSGSFIVYSTRGLIVNSIAKIKSPASGATVSTGKPSLTPSYHTGYTSAPRGYRTQYQFATDVGFTTNLITFNETSYVTYGNQSVQGTWVDGAAIQLTTQLTQGTWYARARIVDDFGGVGAWQTLANPWTVTHVPSASNLQPGTGSQIYNYGTATTFQWSFSDPYSADSQTAYQVIVERISDGLTVWDSGKVTSTGNSASTTIGATYKDTDLRWKVRLWDSENVAGPYASSAATFVLTDPPVVTVTSPSGTITTGIPTINWTNGIPGTKTQDAYRLIYSTGGVTVSDTGWINGASLSYITPVGILSNSTVYTVTVYVRDSYGLTASGTTSFTTGYTAPATPTGAATAQVYLFEYNAKGFVYITMNGTGQDADFQSYVLYRRKYGTSTWEAINAWTTPGVRLAYQDFTATSGSTFEYAVSQIVNRFGDIIESAKVTLRRVSPADDKYWLFSQSDPTKSMPLYSVTADGYTEEYESETYNIIGRGRHTDYGDRLGLNGSITIKLRDRMTNGISKVNYFKNPKFTLRVSDNSDPTLMATVASGTTGTKTVSYVHALEPTPCGDLECLNVNALAMGTATTDYIEVTEAISQADFPIGAATNFVFSFYVGGIPTAVNIGVWFAYYNAANTLLSTSTIVNLGVSEYYLPTPGASHVDYGNSGQFWARYYQAGTTPASYDHMVVGIRMRGTGAGTAGLSKTLQLSSGQLELGTTPSLYVDGDTYGGQWRGDPEISASETTGYYTARQMKQSLEEYKAQKQYGYLRTPFGDVYSVALGNMSLSRIAGVALNEFADVDLPYVEVGF